MDELVAYLLRLAPAAGVFVALLVLVPRRAIAVRIALHIGFFVLARDAMTQSHFWQLSSGALRFTAIDTQLWLLAATSAGLFLLVCVLEDKALEGMRWLKGKAWAAIMSGVVGALTITALAATLKTWAALESLPPVALQAYPVILVFALLGNAYEELLFRGMLQTRLADFLSPTRAAITSGLVFCFCHAFLATTVTNLGAPIFVFTLIEGLVVAVVYQRAGLLGATLAHGLAIFILAVGLY